MGADFHQLIGAISRINAGFSLCPVVPGNSKKGWTVRLGPLNFGPSKDPEALLEQALAEWKRRKLKAEPVTIPKLAAPPKPKPPVIIPAFKPKPPPSPPKIVKRKSSIKSDWSLF